MTRRTIALTSTCFHVLKRCHDAIEEVRLHLKRDAQVELRRQEREHRQTQKRRAQSREKWSDKTAERMKILFQEEPKLKEAYDIVNGITALAGLTAGRICAKQTT